MASADRVRELTRDFFECYPDYFLCRTMAQNVAQGVKSRAEAIQDLSRKARASEQNSERVNEMLDRRTILISGEKFRLRDLSLRDLLELDDTTLAQVVQFYCKHPYAHGRTRKSRFLPRWMRTVFLSALVGHAKSRKLELDYGAYFELITML